MVHSRQYTSKLAGLTRWKAPRMLRTATAPRPRKPAVRWMTRPKVVHAFSDLAQVMAKALAAKSVWTHRAAAGTS